MRCRRQISALLLFSPPLLVICEGEMCCSSGPPSRISSGYLLEDADAADSGSPEKKLDSP